MDTTSLTNSSINSSIVSNPKTPEDKSKLFPVFYPKPLDSKTDDDTNSVPEIKSKKFVCSSLDTDQAVIDAGQKEIGATVCQTCGAVYSIGDPEDELGHKRIHSGLMDKLKLVGWKQERVVGQFPCGRVLSVRPGDPKVWWKKVEEVLKVVDRDLGFSEVGIRKPERTKVYMFVADRKV